MNYYAHAIRFLDRPYVLAGLALPDWLSVVDRSVRVRQRQLDREDLTLSARQREIAFGVRQHLRDDHWFHDTVGFHQVTGKVASLFRDQVHRPGQAGIDGTDERWPYGFLGHLLTELLIDATLIQRDPARLEHYYEQLTRLECAEVAALVHRVTGKKAVHLPLFIELFLRERFLFDYARDDALLHRVNQVLRRVKFPPLPDDVVPVLSKSRALVQDSLDFLLPQSLFGPLPGDLRAADLDRVANPDLRDSFKSRQVDP